jgi:hypothetical protein
MLSVRIKFLSSDCRGCMLVKAVHKKPYGGYGLPPNFSKVPSSRISVGKRAEVRPLHFLIAGRTRWLVECLISTILGDSSAPPATNLWAGMIELS